MLGAWVDEAPLYWWPPVRMATAIFWALAYLSESNVFLGRGLDEQGWAHAVLALVAGRGILVIGSERDDTQTTLNRLVEQGNKQT
jgi:uncharacterized membrane protein